MLVYLIGYMGSGKTTVGKKLSRKLNYRFVDLDAFIENKYRISVSGLFEKYDEKAFRLIEHEALKETFEMPDTIVSTGGGTPCFYNNMEQMNRNGFTVYLKADSKSLYHRLSDSKKMRPLLKGKTPDELLTHIENQLREREPFYLKSAEVVKGESIDMSEFADRITKRISEKKLKPVIDYEKRMVTTPPDLKVALMKAGLLDKFEKISFSHKKEYVEAIEEAKKPETRVKRISQTVEMVRKN